MKFYRMFAHTGASDYVVPGAEIQSVFKACVDSEFQYLDHGELRCSLSEEGGMTFTDFIVYSGCVPLISELFKQALDEAGVDNIFYKPVVLEDKDLKIEERYWLALAPRIECLDKAKSEIETDEDPYCDADEQIREVKKIVIKKGSNGNYKIFKLPHGYANQDIIITEELKDRLEKARLENVHFAPL